MLRELAVNMALVNMVQAGIIHAGMIHVPSAVYRWRTIASAHPSCDFEAEKHLVASRVTLLIARCTLRNLKSPNLISSHIGGAFLDELLPNPSKSGSLFLSEFWICEDF